MKKCLKMKFFLVFLFVSWISSSFFVQPLSQTSRRNEVVLVVEKVGKAVVNISTEQRVRNPFYDSWLDRFFSDFFDSYQESEEYIQNSLGSGVIIDDQGYILTNEHVILGASRINVSLSDKRTFFADVVGTDPSSDLAVLKIDSKEALPYAKLGRSNDIMIGETVIAIGNPFGFSNTVTAGVVSALRRTLKGKGTERSYTDFIQIDAAINPGNSGGALLNIEGELIGINTAIISQAEGIGFSIPIDRAKKVFKELVHYGEVRPLWLGMEVMTLDANIKRYIKTPEDKGAVVINVFKDSPAQRAGIRTGDVITSVERQEVESKEEFDTILSKYRIGDTIRMISSGEKGARTSLLKITDFPYKSFSYEKLGLEISKIDSSIFSTILGPKRSGVVITGIRPSGPADRIGLEKGDIINQINNMNIENVNDYSKLLPNLQSKNHVFMVITRGRYMYRLTMELD